ncbi:MAG: AAA family ATPase [bacterium]
MHQTKFKEVPVEKLRWQCDPKSLGIKTTDDVKCCEDTIGQERALRAIKLGLEIKSPGYNIFVAGLTGTGKSTTVKQILEQIDTTGKVPDDTCYVYNFARPDMPKALRLPPGQGIGLAKDMDELISTLRQHLPLVLETDKFKKQSKDTLQDLEDRSKAMFKELEGKLKSKNLAIVQVQMGPFSRPEIFPIVKEKVVSWDQLEESVEKDEFSRGKLDKLREAHDALSEELENTLRENRKIEKSVQDVLKKLKYEFCHPSVGALVDELKEKYPTKSVQKYLDDVQENILNKLERFTEKEEKKEKTAMPGLPPPPSDEFLEFKVNVLVDNSKLDGVPVITETVPNYKNLLGTIERVMDRNGIWHTDFTKIKAGSMLRANGGYLVLNLLDTILEQGVWTALKRTLKNRKLEIQIYDPFQMMNVALKPEAIDIDIKVVIIGDPSHYQILYSYDEDFKKVFKVKADFDTVMDRENASVMNYASFIRKICDEEKLAPFTSTGVARVVEHGVRLAGRQNKISTRFSDIADVVREAHYWAKEENGKAVKGEHVMKAIEDKIYRSRMIEDKIQEMMDEGVIMIEIEGKKMGQVNGLSVYNLGDYSFGRPAKITAEVSMGRAGIINIEREADLSGKTHNKGVLIIGGYLRGKYAQDKPLSMSASLAFEQSYTGVDGDSASSAEIDAIVSELSGLPLRQDIAVTGSVNQKGEIQPIGGVNQKIEGFYAVCKSRGLSGSQGVTIPHQNVDDLMLKPEVVESVKKREFHIFPIEAVDEGIEILTGVPAGERGEDGSYPEDSVNYLVDSRLKELTKDLRKFYVEEEGEQKESGIGSRE